MQSRSTTHNQYCVVQDLLLHTYQPWNPVSWNSNLVFQLFDPHTTRQILSTPIAFTHREDALVWAGDSSGIYTAKAGFSIYQNNGSFEFNSSGSSFGPLVSLQKNCCLFGSC